MRARVLCVRVCSRATNLAWARGRPTAEHVERRPSDPVNVKAPRALVKQLRRGVVRPLLRGLAAAARRKLHGWLSGDGEARVHAETRGCCCCVDLLGAGVESKLLVDRAITRQYLDTLTCLWRLDRPLERVGDAEPTPACELVGAHGRDNQIVAHVEESSGESERRVAHRRVLRRCDVDLWPPHKRMIMNVVCVCVCVCV
jgi:hypothetical protein